MTNAPERIWIEDEFGEGDDDQWTYGTWDVRNYRGYVVEYVRADTVQELTAERDRLREALERIAGVKGPYSHPFPESNEGYGSFAIVTAREALKGETP